ncbi:MAG: hypothetical protein R3C56_20890 [Pirellulaceae bacterium]
MADKVDSSPKVVGIMCNTVATAKSAINALLKIQTISAGPSQDNYQSHCARSIATIKQTDCEVESRHVPIGVHLTSNFVRRAACTGLIEVGADYDFDVDN